MAELVRRCLSVKGEERPPMREVAMELKGLRMMHKRPGQCFESEESRILALWNLEAYKCRVMIAGRRKAIAAGTACDTESVTYCN
ncbi:hypothetical protein Patl1_08236 [Pistacia atlantica]|uniref:Uncharacterized protein n=1 Tax=Pistacia atlantica TaxID=434234 RepID=A0ACC1AK79_9ROSI|nr:hypothetical protein Patl1_08236 [Pistacia atlantica]